MLPESLESALYGFMRSHVLFACDRLGLFQSLIQVPGGTAAELAATTGLVEDGVERLLLAATACGLLEKREDRFCVPGALVPFLDPASPRYLGGNFRHYQSLTARVFDFLDDALREGRPQWGKVFGGELERDLFSQIYAREEDLAGFVESMWSMGIGPSRELVAQFSLADRKRLVDVGGCSGSFTVAALQANPALEAVVFDLPKVEPFLAARAAQFALERRLRFQPGDFFVDSLPEGDVYALGYILSDWTRQDGDRLLARIHEALPAGGLVIVLEKLFDDDKRGPMGTAMMNLAMYLETWGKHHSAAEYRARLEAVGFHQILLFRSSGDKHMLVARKPDRP